MPNQHIYDTKFIPTFLYIKQHPSTGLLYLGKTIKNPLKYKGSGKYWRRHLDKHGSDINTLWYCLYIDKEELVKAAKSLSLICNVVSDENWANLEEETGLGCDVDTIKKRVEINKTHQTYKNMQKPEARRRAALSRVGQKDTENTKLKKAKSVKANWDNMSLEDREKRRIANVESHSNIKYTIKTPSGEIKETINLREFCVCENINYSSASWSLRYSKAKAYKGFELISKEILLS